MDDIDPCRIADRKLAEIKRKMFLSVQEHCDNLIIDSLKDCSLFYWTTREGERLFIGDMKDSHLLNCIKHLARNGNYNPIIAYEYVRRQLKSKNESER